MITYHAGWGSVVLFLWSTALAQSLVVEKEEFDPIVCTNKFVLTNRSHELIFAWSYRCVDLFANGEEVADSPRSTYLGGPIPSMGGLLVTPGIRVGPLKPGEHEPARCGCSGRRLTAPAGIRVEILAVVLEGGRTEGNAEDGQNLLRDIAVQRAAKQRLLGVLKNDVGLSDHALAILKDETAKIWEFLKQKDIPNLWGLRTGYLTVKNGESMDPDAEEIHVPLSERVTSTHFHQLRRLITDLNRFPDNARYHQSQISIEIAMLEAWLAARDW